MTEPETRAGAKGSRSRWAWALTVLYMALIFFLSSLPNPLPVLTASVSDKILHGVEYAGLAGLMCFALRASGLSPAGALVLAAAAASAYGVTDEWHQSFVPSRDGNVGDWLADTAGALVGAAGASVFLRLLRVRASID